MKLSLGYILLLTTAVAIFSLSLRVPHEGPFQLILLLSLGVAAIAAARWLNISKPTDDALPFIEFAICGLIILIGLMLLSPSYPSY
jgi:hypothetical protein